MILGSIAGQVVSWSDTQVIANVVPGALSGIARIQQSGVWSNALGFVVPGSGGSAAKLLPAVVNMAVGDTRTLQAVNAAGQTVTGLTWNSSDATVVSLSTDNPPVLTALAAGHVTITAGGASADVTVSAGPLPSGTLLWSIPGPDVNSIVPAVPSASGVADVFAFHGDGTVQAVTSDGAVAWTANIGQPCQTLADFQGGLVMLQCNGNIVKLDGLTGQAYPAFTGGQGNSLSVHTYGTVFTTLYPSAYNQPGAVIGIDPVAGTQKFRVPIPNDSSGIIPGGVMIAGDGYAYAPFSTRDYCGLNCEVNHLKLLRVNSAGASAQWDLQIPGDGTYTLEAWWAAAPEQQTWTHQAVYEVVAAGTVVATGTLDQTQPGDQWYKIATVALKTADKPFLRIRNAGTGRLVADSVHIWSSERYNDGSPANTVRLAPLDGILLHKR